MEVQPAVEPRLSEVDEVVSGDWQLLSVELDFERTHGRLYGCSLWHVKSVGQILVVSTNGVELFWGRGSTRNALLGCGRRQLLTKNSSIRFACLHTLDTLLRRPG